MNDVMRLLFERKSVRAYEERTIPERDKEKILQAALQAPTAGNQILYTILDITEQHLKDELALTCDNQPFIAKAPLVLVFLADCRRWLDCYRYAGAPFRNPGLGDLMLACSDALIAAQNAVMAAASLEIGSCYIGDILENKERVVPLLHLDEYVFPVTMLVFGYPTEQQKKRKKPRRFDAKYIVQKNTYHPLDEETLRKMHREQSEDEHYDFDAQIRAFCKRKYMSDFSLEMTRSVKEYLKNFE
jgi:nitroreductase